MGKTFLTVKYFWIDLWVQHFFFEKRPISPYMYVIKKSHACFL